MTSPHRRTGARPQATPPPTHRLPGLTLAVALAGLSMVVNAYLPLVSSLLVAIVLGMVLRNVGLVPVWAEPGFAVAAKPVLRVGVVLLGLRLSVPQVLELGWGVVAVIVLTVVLTYLTALGAGRALGVGRATRTLVATGTAVCGAAAVAAMSAVLGRRTDEHGEDVQEAAATAVATVTIFGTIALAAVPALAMVLGLGDDVAAVWVGASVHEVGQVVAGAGLVGAGVLDVAVLTKLGRVVLLAPMVALVGVTENRRARRGLVAEVARREVDDVTSGRPVEHSVPRPAPLVPVFVLAFLVMIVLRSLLPIPDAVVDASQLLATALLTTAMVAMGAAVKLRVLIGSGGRALVLGAVAGLVAAGVSLGGLVLVG